ncbi:(4Fe-4S)-binding protein [Marivirga arenosa]|uniref:(4Fe-4S)-binding protein n=1 Tax=Marivirga arenosa TaxID=3059076 RepID=A0AA51N5C5_9BACT|nr:(4Fe-4S)-binding protein [Marivirga sp. ABR2-2]WMN05920.1 (4Fe-4S)-binding protein [Marivirga sp. ABR2-2]
MKIKPTKRTYESEDLVVVWQPSLCMHSEKCWRGLPDVFQRDAKPWVNMDGADDKRIKEQVDMCPSGALSAYWKNEETEKSFKHTDTIQIEVSKNGPLIVKGKIKILHSDGETEIKEKNTALCRCGSSKNKPFCDGTHHKIKFEG